MPLLGVHALIDDGTCVDINFRAAGLAVTIVEPEHALVTCVLLPSDAYAHRVARNVYPPAAPFALAHRCRP